MEIVPKLTRIIICLVVIILGMLIYILSDYYTIEKKEENLAFCGTTDPVDNVLKDKSKYRFSANFIGNDFDPDKGFYVFKENCASCHSLQKDIIIIGPPLYNIFARIPKDPTWIYIYLKNSETLKKSNDKYFKTLKGEYVNNEWDHSKSAISDKELIDVVGFIGMNK